MAPGRGTAAKRFVTLLVFALVSATLAQSIARAIPEDAEEGASEATTDDGRLQLIRSRRSSLEQELTRLRRRERSLLGEVEQLELEVQLRSEQLREVRLVLQQTNEQLDATLENLGALEKSIEKARPVLAARARALYKLGDLSYLRLLLSVDNPADFFRGYRFVTALARRDNERFASFKRSRDEVVATRAVLEQRTQEALALRTDVSKAKQQLDGDRKRKTALLTEIVEEKEVSAAYVAELAEAERQLGEMISGLGVGRVSIPVTAFRGALPWPTPGPVRVRFGKRKHPKFDTYTLHNGIDIAAPQGTEVTTVHEGTVMWSGRFRGYGLLVVIDHGGGHHSLYAHLERADVQVGDRLEAKQVIGSVGSTGLDGPGLYFELRFRGRAQDPQTWLAAR